MNKIIFVLIVLTGCTNISITVVHTQGMADDVVDSEQSPSTQATVSPNVTIPASVIP